MTTKYRQQVPPPSLDIRAFREFAGLSLDDAARRITSGGFPITKAGLGNIETGTRGPSQEFLEAWTRAMDELARSVYGGKVTSVPQFTARTPRAARSTEAAA